MTVEGSRSSLQIGSWRRQDGCGIKIGNRLVELESQRARERRYEAGVTATILPGPPSDSLDIARFSVGRTGSWLYVS